MPRIVFDNLGGISPRAGDGKANGLRAKCAINTKFWNGNLAPFPCPTLCCEKENPILTMYENEFCECLTWDTKVDIVESCGMVIWTGDGKPQMATKEELCEGISCCLGVPCPTSSPVATTNGSEICDCQYGQIIYRYRNKYGHVGVASPLSNTIVVGEFITVSNIATPPPEYCIEQVDVFMAVAGNKTGLENQVSSNAGMQFIGTLPLTGGTLDGRMLSPSFEFDSANFYPPPDDLGCIVKTSYGLAGISGNNVYFTEAGQDCAWSKWKTLDEELIALKYWNNSLFAFGKQGSVYRMDEVNSPTGYGFSSPFDYGGQKFKVSSDKCGIAVGQSGIAFATTHGIAIANRNQIQYLTDANFDLQNYCSIDPSSIMLEFMDYGLAIFSSQASIMYEFSDGKFNSVQGNVYELPFKPTSTMVDCNGILNYSVDNKWYKFSACSDVTPQAICGLHHVCSCQSCCEYQWCGELNIADNHIKLTAGFIEFVPNFGDLTLKVYTEECGTQKVIKEMTFDSSTETCGRQSCFRKYFRIDPCKVRDKVYIELSGCSEHIRTVLGTSKSSLNGS